MSSYVAAPVRNLCLALAPSVPQEGLVCLANDEVVEWLIALAQSLRVHSPDLNMTIIPFDDQLVATRMVAATHGFKIYDGPGLAEMDEVGEAYWGADVVGGHSFRKFCAWQTYDRFMFLDADVVALTDLAPYLRAFSRSDASFAYFAADVAQVYRPGDVREMMVQNFASVGFNSGIFMGNRGDLAIDDLRAFAASVTGHRHGFVDILDQSFMNYCIDRSRLPKVDANHLVDDFMAAAAVMRLIRDPAGGMVVSDRRVAETGRPVSLIHWSGYSLSPLMPYRDVFLRYRIPGANPLAAARYEAKSLLSLVRQKSPSAVFRRIGSLPYKTHAWLAARGIVRWRGSRA